MGEGLPPENETIPFLWVREDTQKTSTCRKQEICGSMRLKKIRKKEGFWVF
jgi:hypothetical protein